METLAIRELPSSVCAFPLHLGQAATLEAWEAMLELQLCLHSPVSGPQVVLWGRLQTASLVRLLAQVVDSLVIRSSFRYLEDRAEAANGVLHPKLAVEEAPVEAPF